MDPYIIPDFSLPVIPPRPVEPPTRGMAPPITRGIQPPNLMMPQADIPEWQTNPGNPITNPDPGPPIISPPPQQQEEETEPEETRELPMAPFDASTEITVTVPVVGNEVTIPVPKPEVVITAGTTAMTAAVTATGAAIFAKPLFEKVQKLLKPLAKKIAKKILKKKEKVYPEPVECKLPPQFLFSSLHLSPLLSRQHRDRRKEKKGAGKPPSESSPNTSEP